MDLRNRIVKYFTTKRNIAKFLAFVYAFAVGFILLVNPFEVKSWIDWESNDQYVLTVCLVVGIGFLVLLVSRLVMYLLRNRLVIDFKKYLVWILCEVVCVAIFCTLFAWKYNETEGFFDILPRTLKYVALILLCPYVLSWLYMALKDKREMENDAVVDEPNPTTTEDRKTELSSSISETELIGKERHNIVNFCDEKGQLKLSVDIDNLLYIESADNYVNIYYSNKGKFSRFMLRSTLKSIEENFADCDLVRCHRSYVVNFKKVKVLRKEKEGLFIDLDFEKSPEIPVSKTYAESIVNLFTKHSLL